MHMKRSGGDLKQRLAKKPRLDSSNAGTEITEFYIPPEIVEHILSFISEDQKTKLRLVNSVWCNMIKKTYFRIGCILPNEINSLVERFSGYTELIGLRLDKTYKLSSQDLEPVFKLTNLTSLEVYPLHTTQPSKAVVIPFDAFFRHPATNLQQLTIAQIDTNHVKHIPNVTKLVTDHAPSNILTLMPQLVSLQTRASAFATSSISTKLTRLEADCNIERTLEGCPALKALKSYAASGRPPINLSKFTNLESLEVQYNGITSIPSNVSMLTSLNYFRTRTLKDPVCLKTLVVHGVDDLSKLTALETLYIHGTLEVGITPQFYSFSSLKELSVKLLNTFQVPPLAQLHNLEYLNVKYEFYDDAEVDMEPIMTLTCLTALVLNSFTKVTGFRNITRLTDLQKLNQLAKMTEDINISTIHQLTKLTSLSWKSPTKFYSANMTNLRELHLSSQGNHVANFNLPSVTSLSISADKSNSFWWSVRTLTSLRELTLYNLTDGTKLLHFTTLRHLTLLNNLMHKCKGYTITALTRLQQFYFSPPVDWSKSFTQEIKEKLPYLEHFLSYVSSRVD